MQGGHFTGETAPVDLVQKLLFFSSFFKVFFLLFGLQILSGRGYLFVELVWQVFKFDLGLEFVYLAGVVPLSGAETL